MPEHAREVAGVNVADWGDEERPGRDVFAEQSIGRPTGTFGTGRRRCDSLTGEAKWGRAKPNNGSRSLPRSPYAGSRRLLRRSANAGAPLAEAFGVTHGVEFHADVASWGMFLAPPVTGDGEVASGVKALFAYVVKMANQR